MDAAEEDEDLKLVQASSGLLSDLEACLPKVLWRPSKAGATYKRVHKQVRQRDLDYVLKLVYTLSSSSWIALMVSYRSSLSKASPNFSMLD